MRTSRFTVLLKDDERAEWEARAARRGVSSSEYVRQVVNDDDELTPEQEAELAALVQQANDAMPKMAASLDRMSARLEKSNREMDAFLRQVGIRA